MSNNKRYIKQSNKFNENKKVIYKVANWSEYNKSLIQRGNITIWLSNKAINKWRYSGKHKQGAPKIYSDLAITTLLNIRSLFHLPLRATQGFVMSLISLMGINLSVPDYSTISRRQKVVKLNFPRYKKHEHLNIIIDSTGLKVYGDGEWKVRRYSYSKRRTWRKLHIAIDQNSGNIIANSLTTNSSTDSNAGKELLDNINIPISSLIADKGYDTSKIYKFCHNLNIEPIIRPQQNARIRSDHFWLKRNKAVLHIKNKGSSSWKKASGYSKRALVENTVFRYKKAFGDKPLAHSLENQKVEAFLNCNLLNKFFKLGRPISYAVVL